MGRVGSAQTVHHRVRADRRWGVGGRAPVIADCGEATARLADGPAGAGDGRHGSHAVLGLAARSALFESVGDEEQFVFEPGEGLGIDPIARAVTAIDEPPLARIGHQHLVPEALEQAAHPGRMGPDLEDHPTAGKCGAVSLERRGRGAQPFRGPDLPAGIEGAALGEAVAEIQADR